MTGGKEAVEKSAFDRVIAYFLGHEKTKEDAKKPAKRIAKSRKKPPTKPKKRA